MNTKIISPGALHLLLDFDCFIDYKEDFIQDIFRDLGLGETLLKKGCITVRVTCKNL